MSALLIYIILLIFLILLSGFFSSAETAFTSLSIIQIAEIKDKGGVFNKAVSRLMKRPEVMLTTILFGNNLVNIAATTIAAKMTIDMFGENADRALTVSTILLTFIILIFAEVSPKQVALNHNEAIAKFAAPFVLFLTWVFRPFIIVITFISNTITKVTSLKKKRKPISLQGILHMVNIAEDIGVVEEYETDMVRNVFRLNDIPVSSIMTHRTDVFSLNRELSVQEALVLLQKERIEFSRIPIYKDDSEFITGFVMYKDILRAKQKEAKLKDFEIPPVFVSEMKKVNDLFGMFKIKKQKLAVILDEYGGLAGIVTQEDVIEEIFGELYDERDKREDERLIQLNVDTFRIKGDMPTDIFNEEFEEHLEYSKLSQTLAGYMAEQLDRIPEVQDSVEIRSGILKVEEVSKNHAETIIYKKLVTSE